MRGGAASLVRAARRPWIGRLAGLLAAAAALALIAYFGSPGFERLLRGASRARLEATTEVALAGGALLVGLLGLSAHLARAARLRAREAEAAQAALRAENEARRRVQQELERAARELARSNEELERFAYVASHDLQEPLRMVTSFVQLLERRYKGRLDGDADEFIGFAVDGAARMKRLIEDLLAYSRVGTRSNVVPVDLGQTLARVLADLGCGLAESGGEVESGPLPVVDADPVQMEQLLRNLIGNALKFKSAEPPRIRIAAERTGQGWTVAVRDNGIGIEPDFFARIFIVFQRLHGHQRYPGTGIGLAICKKIVERHGGRIWVESAPGHGAEFRFTLPARGLEEVS